MQAMYKTEMAKGKHRPARRIELPNGMWILIYDDGSLKLAGYDRRIKVTEVLNRKGGAHVFVNVEETKSSPANISARPTDLVTIERRSLNALRRLQ